MTSIYTRRSICRLLRALVVVVGSLPPMACSSTFRQLSGLLEMEGPLSSSHLEQFFSAIQWVKHGIPNFIMRIELRRNFLECLYNRARRRSKRAVGRISLAAMDWSSNERTAFEDFKRALAAQVMVAHCDVKKHRRFYTDASDTVWSDIVSQLPRKDLDLPYSEFWHRPLACLSGRLDATQLK